MQYKEVFKLGDTVICKRDILFLDGTKHVKGQEIKLDKEIELCYYNLYPSEYELKPKPDLVTFISEVESRFFRTNHDTGANSNAMLIWNMVREYAGLRHISKDDLPQYCESCKTYHVLNMHR